MSPAQFLHKPSFDHPRRSMQVSCLRGPKTVSILTESYLTAACAASGKAEKKDCRLTTAQGRSPHKEIPLWSRTNQLESGDPGAPDTELTIDPGVTRLR